MKHIATLTIGKTKYKVEYTAQDVREEPNKGLLTNALARTIIQHYQNKIKFIKQQ